MGYTSEELSIEDVQRIKSNKFCTTCHFVEAGIIALAYLVEYMKGARTIGYVILTLVLALACPIAEVMIFRNNPMSTAIKHLVGFGFGIFYIFICFTTTNKLAFLYVVPMLIIITSFNDYKYCAKINITAWLVNVAQVIYFFKEGVYTKEDSATVEIQVLAMLVLAIYAVYTSKTICTNNEMQNGEIAKRGDDAERVLSDTLAVSNDMGTNIERMDQEISELSQAVEDTKNAMGEVSEGSTEIAEAVQRQTYLTDNIQEKSAGVEQGAQQILRSIDDVNVAVKDGNRNVTNLVEQVEQSVVSGRQVADELSELRNSMAQMNSVVEIINNITSQTSLLALNASIEAARAGDAGRGFAVVASEISKMASETDQATSDIRNMVEEVSNTIERVVDVTGGMIELIEGQHDATEATARSFNDIENCTREMLAHSTNLSGYIDELSEANTEIVDSISTISAITEEVAAHATNTFEISDNNIRVMQNVVEYSERLKELAEQLKQD